MSDDDDSLRVSENRRVGPVSDSSEAEFNPFRAQPVVEGVVPLAEAGAKARFLPVHRVSPNRHPRQTSSPAVVAELTQLVQRVFLPIGLQEAARSVLFTTTPPPRGVGLIAGWKSNDGGGDNVASATAEILARRTARTTCLVDANLRDPGLHRRFGTDNASGLCDILLGSKRLLEVTVKLASNLFLVPAGPRVGHLVPSDEMLRAVVSELVATFDFVIVSGPPLAAQSVAFPLASAVDSVVLVLNRDSTHRDAARSAMEKLRASDARVAGVVLSQGRRAAAPRQSRSL